MKLFFSVQYIIRTVRVSEEIMKNKRLMFKLIKELES